MLNLRKTILNSKIEKIIKNFPFVLFIQLNNVTPKNWSSIKNELSEKGIINTCKIKNKIAVQLLKNTDITRNVIFSSSTEKSALVNLLQGSTLMIGCPILAQLTFINTILEKNKDLLFTGGIFENKVVTNLDFKEIIKLDKSIFVLLNKACSSPIHSLLSLQHFTSLSCLSCFSCAQNSLLNTLSAHKKLMCKQPETSGCQ